MLHDILVTLIIIGAIEITTNRLENAVGTLYNDVARDHQLTNLHARARNLIFTVSTAFRTGWLPTNRLLVLVSLFRVAFTTISVTDF